MAQVLIQHLESFLEDLKEIIEIEDSLVGFIDCLDHVFDLEVTEMGVVLEEGELEDVDGLGGGDFAFGFGRDAVEGVGGNGLEFGLVLDVVIHVHVSLEDLLFLFHYNINLNN